MKGQKFEIFENFCQDSESWEITYFIELVVKSGTYKVAVSNPVLVKKVEIFEIFGFLRVRPDLK